MKLIVFCDYGLDDAAATYDLLRRAKGYEAIDLVAIGGNVPPAVALKNALKLLAGLDFPLPPRVRVVDTTAVSQPYRFLKDIHGDDGMGDLLPETQETSVPVVGFSEWLLTAEEGYALLSLGPMTLVKTLVGRAAPSRFVFMGGNIAETPNYHGYEFNHALDREAFSACVKLPHVAITMDTCRVPVLNIQDCGLSGTGMLRDLVRRSRELTFRSGEKGCYIWDDLAVKYLLHPDWFKLETRADRDGNLLTVARYVLNKPFTEIVDE